MSDEPRLILLKPSNVVVRIGEDGNVYAQSWADHIDWIGHVHVGWLDREDDGYWRARTPEGSSLGAHPSRDAAVEAMLRSER